MTCYSLLVALTAAVAPLAMSAYVDLQPCDLGAGCLLALYCAVDAPL